MQVGDRVRVKNDTAIYPEFSGSGYGPSSSYAGQEGSIIKEILDPGAYDFKYRVAFQEDSMGVGFQEHELEVISDL